MNKIKNIFDYATNELSQDAFLRWLFENYNCDNEKVRNICYKLLNHLGINIEYGDINKLETFAQWKKIDVLVEIHTNDERNIVLAIEDKTFSGEHNQLKDYDEAIAEEYEKNRSKENWEIHKTFYKTDLLNDRDKDACGKEWKCLFIDKIYEFFKNNEFDETGSEFLDFYISHIKKLYRDLTEISNENMEDWNLLNFQTYLDKTFVEPNKNKYINENIHFVKWGWRNIYSSMAIYKMYDKHTRLSLEIVTRHKSECANIKISTRKILKDSETQVSHELKEILKNYLNDNIYFDDDNNAMIEIVNKSKNEIAKSSDLLNSKLCYSNNINDITDTIYDVIDWFLNICNRELSDICNEHNIKEYNEPSDFKYIIIKIREDQAKDRYEKTRKCWKIQKPEVDRYPYVFSVTNGIVREIYKVDEWFESENGRYEFKGRVASDSKKEGFIRSLYINKRIPNYYSKKGMANPVIFSDGKIKK